MGKIIKCKNKYCKKEFEAIRHNSTFCSISCRNEYKRTEILLKGKLGYDYIICNWDNKPVGKYMSSHIKKYFPNRTYEEYVMEFPDQPNMPDKYKTNITKNSGKHMKSEKYKRMFSEMYKGEKNSNHRSNTTKLQRQLCSKYSREYWHYNFPEMTEEEITKKISKFAKESQKDRLTTTQLEYWIKKGYSEEEAKKKLRERQITFSLDTCIEKYGEIEGRKKWLERQEKWHKNYKKSNFSKISQELFHIIYDIVKNDYEKIYFAELKDGKIDKSGSNNEYKLKLNEILVLPDFLILDSKKIIEFDGVYYHRSTPENAKRERRRDKALVKEGYKILHVNEKDYRENPDKIIEQCVVFINN